jgi:CheY-like chemotaxis protein/predicted regulator of Ras-like GTPase activity (Roadblock/LC7/MglB family)
MRPAVQDPVAPEARAPTMRVLIVDDEASVRLAIERRLRADNIATVQASNVKQAIDRLRAEPFDVVLCDLRMPGGDGSELVSWLSSYSPSTRIVVMSAYVTDEFRSTYGSSPELTILEKPLDLATLVGILEQFGPRRGFYGNAIELELFDYVQMIALSGRDKLVEVETPQAVGRIWFEHGDIVHVEYRDFRGEMAFYKLLASGRGTFREVFNSPPPKVTVLRSSTHLLMEAARLADEGLLGDEDPLTGEPDEVEEVFDETSFEDLNSELQPGARSAEGSEPPQSIPANEVPERDQESMDHEVGGVPTTPVLDVPEFENPEDLFAPPDSVATAMPEPPSPVTPEPVSTATAKIKDEVSFDEDDLAMLEALTEMDDDSSTEEFVGEMFIESPAATASPPSATTTLSEATATRSEVPAAPARAEEPSESSGHEQPDVESQSPPPPAAQPAASGDEQSAAYAGVTSHAIFDDPDMRNVMLEQFWQFEGVNGVAIISSTGKVLAEDMRSNSSLVTLAGFYMRGAARIARTLGHNVFDGVVARSVNGQQMVMVSMGAASAVLSVEPGVDPEGVRDAVMGVE